MTYDPTLSVADAFLQFAAGKLDNLNRSLVQQVVPGRILALTRSMIDSPDERKIRNALAQYPIDMKIARDNLLRAWKAGVTLVTGSDAGNMMVFHGPTVQRELELWVEAGIPVKVALQAATLNGARSLRADARFGSVEKGKEATLLVVDGNPLEDVESGGVGFVCDVQGREDWAGPAGSIRIEGFERVRARAGEMNARGLREVRIVAATVGERQHWPQCSARG